MWKLSTIPIYVLCGNLLLFYLGLEVAGECIRNAECQCVMKGTHLGVNLNNISTTNTSTLEEEGVSVVFNPCKNIDLRSTDLIYKNKSILVDNGCNDTSSICLMLVQVKMINIGQHEQFTYETAPNGTLYMSSHWNGWSTRIKLTCDNTSNTDKLTLVSIDVKNQKLELELTSKSSCLTEHVIQLSEGSGWSTFFLIIFMALVVYFVGGILFKKIFYENLTGMEILPNHLFWVNVVETFMDFVKYVSNGCSRPSYDQI